MSGSNLRLIARWFELQTAHDTRMMATLFADNVVYEDVALGLVKHGPTEVVDLMRTLYHAFPDYAVTLVSAVADDERGGAKMIMSGINERGSFGNPGIGKRFEIRAAAVMCFRDTRISCLRDY